MYFHCLFPALEELRHSPFPKSATDCEEYEHDRRGQGCLLSDLWQERMEQCSVEKPLMPEEQLRTERRRARFFEYLLPGDWLVLAGRTSADNDYLSVVAAKPQDWWFHVRGQAGSHVILRAKSDQEPSRKTLREAAAIAAFHSKARSGGTVPVSVTQARYVTKPPGSKPGTVQIRKESVLMVKPALPEPSREKEPSAGEKP